MPHNFYHVFNLPFIIFKRNDLYWYIILWSTHYV